MDAAHGIDALMLRRAQEYAERTRMAREARREEDRARPPVKYGAAESQNDDKTRADEVDPVAINDAPQPDFGPRLVDIKV